MCDFTAKEGRTIKRRLISKNGYTFGFDALHNALNGRDPEIIQACFHSESIYSNYQVCGPLIHQTHLELDYLIRYKVFACTIRFSNRFNQILRYIN